MKTTSLVTAALLCAVAGQAQAEAFNRIAAFEVPLNLPEGADPATETSAEIIAATADGMTVVYSDSPLGALGIVDITDPANPAPGGSVDLGGEPTSVAVVGGKAIAAVNTSESYTAPSGLLKVIDLATKEVTASCALGGQPDSIAVAPDGRFLAVAIENERDEDLDDGVIPQMPAGSLVIVPLANAGPDCAGLKTVDMTGLAEIAPEDPEPEFVSINAAGDIAVTLQENNHIVIVGADGTILSHFSAGSVRLDGVDVAEEGALSFTGSISAKREPDAVVWIDENHIAVANEGDYEGGSRTVSIFDREGNVVWDSGTEIEYALARTGHYPEKRSENKGGEPEGLAFAVFDETAYLFALSERGSAVAVFDLSADTPTLVGLLPSGIAPEGAVAIPARGLLVTANEADLGEDGGARSHVMIYRLEDAAPTYPTIMSDAEATPPIGWGALSGLATDPDAPGTLYAVNDSFYATQPTIFTIDATQTPAIITDALPVTRDGAPAEKLDLEGITLDGEGGFWLASEGNTDKDVPHQLLHVDAGGAIVAAVPFPPVLLEGEKRFGAEGVAMVDGTLWVTIQREWGDDPKGMVKLVAYTPATGAWGGVHYPLDDAETGWMGLSDIAVHGDLAYILERDNQIGSAAEVKRIYSVPLAALKPASLEGELPEVDKTLVRDLLPDMAAFHGYIVDKVEGLAIGADGTGYLVTDNDGVDDSSGETFFWSVPHLAD
ncbi:esterase-like activity of phytase family protein [Acuticoccus sp. I52.16.1]|uniref:esterase-like activity of phytase family protein n=1 Tax=Acuticoccus sp. I52.16.1 TaxID=2928472 RepID=UPI001FD191C8|nr:esterase-like activity of phytase family protein [Acuticoccus sp. I52.16.1]UOM33471.1 esterase-like activity of phytase family protein [Acuticoccus sp. I52.16.1]